MPELRHLGSGTIGPANIGSNQIARALADTTQFDDAALSRLREAVCDYVRLQKAMETPPESIIATAKTLVKGCGAPFELCQSLTANVVDWCIAAYYGKSRGDLPIALKPALPGDS